MAMRILIVYVFAHSLLSHSRLFSGKGSGTNSGNEDSDYLWFCTASYHTAAYSVAKIVAQIVAARILIVYCFVLSLLLLCQRGIVSSHSLRTYKTGCLYRPCCSLIRQLSTESGPALVVTGSDELTARDVFFLANERQCSHCCFQFPFFNAIVFLVQ